MVLAHDDDPNDSHPYWYARILGIFHAHVSYRGSSPQKMEFLFVRWFGRDLSYRAGWKARRLHRIGFLADDVADAYGFLDPNDIVRATHLIPAFAQDYGVGFVQKFSTGSTAPQTAPRKTHALRAALQS